MYKSIAGVTLASLLAAGPAISSLAESPGEQLKESYKKVCDDLFDKVRNGGDIRYNYPVSKDDAKLVFPDSDDYRQIRDIQDGESHYLFYRKKDSNRGWDLVAVRNNDISKVYVMNGKVEDLKEFKLGIIRGYDIGFWIEPGNGMSSLDSKLKEHIFHAYHTCGMPDRRLLDYIFNNKTLKPKFQKKS